MQPDNPQAQPRLRLIKESDDVPDGWVDFKCEINTQFFNKACSQNGGQLSMKRLNEIFIDGEMLEIFLKDATPIIPPTDLTKSTKVHIAFEKNLYRDMKTIYSHMPHYDGPAAHTFQLSIFAFGWLKNVLKLRSVDEVKLLMTYLHNANANDFSEVLKILEQVSRRLNNEQ